MQVRIYVTVCGTVYFIYIKSEYFRERYDEIYYQKYVFPGAGLLQLFNITNTNPLYYIWLDHL